MSDVYRFRGKRVPRLCEPCVFFDARVMVTNGVLEFVQRIAIQ
jgi:hypothetical protein